MCGRYKQTSPLQTLKELYGLGEAADFQPLGIAAPGMRVPVIRGGNSLDHLMWGFIPHFAKDDKTRLINARAETIAEKPSFRESFATRRCLIPANGFYEWDKTQNPAQPYDIHFDQDAPFAMAGLWDSWTHPGTGEVRETVLIITTIASAKITHIHERMPAILRTRRECLHWMDRAASAKELKNLLAPCDSASLHLTAAVLEKKAANEDAAGNVKQLPLF